MGMQRDDKKASLAAEEEQRQDIGGWTHKGRPDQLKEGFEDWAAKYRFNY